MKMKIAIPVNESGNLDSHFGHCRYFSVHTTENGQIISEELMQPPPHEPGILPEWLNELEVTDVLTGGIGNHALKLLGTHNINVYTGAPVMDARKLVRDFLTNSVQFTNNRCDH